MRDGRAKNLCSKWTHSVCFLACLVFYIPFNSIQVLRVSNLSSKKCLLTCLFCVLHRFNNFAVSVLKF